jgi:hypothetical protein
MILIDLLEKLFYGELKSNLKEQLKILKKTNQEI